MASSSGLARLGDRRLAGPASRAPWSPAQRSRAGRSCSSRGRQSTRRSWPAPLQGAGRNRGAREAHWRAPANPEPRPARPRSPPCPVPRLLPRRGDPRASPELSGRLRRVAGPVLGLVPCQVAQDGSASAAGCSMARTRGQWRATRRRHSGPVPLRPGDPDVQVGGSQEPAGVVRHEPLELLPALAAPERAHPAAPPVGSIDAVHPPGTPKGCRTGLAPWHARLRPMAQPEGERPDRRRKA